MRILITGASGLLGHALIERLARDHDLALWSYTQAVGAFTSVDLRDASAVASTMRTAAPDLVIHAAANRDPDFCEAHPDQAAALNVDATRNLLESADNWNARLVFISTDYVFDGTSPPYREEASVNPLNVYGQTKVEAETLVRSSADHLIVRIPVLYGRGAKPDNDLIQKLRAAIASPDPVHVDDVNLRTPTWTADVADALAILIEKNAVGAFHVSSGEVMTAYTMAKTLAGVLGLPADHIHPGPAPARQAPRPVAALLDTEKIRRFGFDRFTPFRQGLQKVLRS